MTAVVIAANLATRRNSLIVRLKSNSWASGMIRKNRMRLVATVSNNVVDVGHHPGGHPVGYDDQKQRQNFPHATIVAFEREISRLRTGRQQYEPAVGLQDAESNDRIVPMTFFRSARPQRIVALLFLLTGLLSQVQVVFACDLMGGRPGAVCCCSDDMSEGCDMGGGCPLTEGMPTDAGCCDVSVGTLSEISMGAANFAAAQVTQLEAPRPPPASAYGAIVPLAVPRIRLLSTPPRTPAPSRSAAVYLVTNRIRI